MLADAWRRVAARRPDARLHLVGTGTLDAVAESLAGDGVEWQRRIEAPEVAAAFDRARALLLPSASEGLPRIAIESFLRGRAVVGSRAGGIPDIVEDGVNGILVKPGDAADLAAAIERILDDDALAARLGAARRRERRPLGRHSGRVRRPDAGARRRGRPSGTVKEPSPSLEARLSGVWTPTVRVGKWAENRAGRLAFLGESDLRRRARGGDRRRPRERRRGNARHSARSVADRLVGRGDRLLPRLRPRGPRSHPRVLAGVAGSRSRLRS